MEGEDRGDLQRKKGTFGMFEGVWVEKQEIPRKGGETHSGPLYKKRVTKKPSWRVGQVVIHARA